MNEEQKNNGLIQPAPKQFKICQCPCAEQPPAFPGKGRTYSVLVDPQLKDGSAQIKALACNSCGHLVEVSEDALVGKKEQVYVDDLGRRHFRLKCDPVNLGAKLG